MGGDLKEGINTLPTVKTYISNHNHIKHLFLWLYWIYCTPILYYFSNHVYDNLKVMIPIKNKVSKSVMNIRAAASIDDEVMRSTYKASTYLLHHLKIYCMCLNIDSCGESKFVMINDEFWGVAPRRSYMISQRFFVCFIQSDIEKLR